jgi:uncharacterized membrane protein (UPF0127 family)
MENWITYSVIFICAIILFIVCGYFFEIYSKPVKEKANVDLEVAEVKVKDKTYQVEIADDPASQQKGLMNRANLPTDQGMLFVFDKTNYYPFWMKNTLIPLDIIWIDNNKKVVFIKENAQPCSNVVQAICQSVIPTKLAKYVLELNAGQVKEINLSVGDSIDFAL